MGTFICDDEVYSHICGNKQFDITSWNLHFLDHFNKRNPHFWEEILNLISVHLRACAPLLSCFLYSDSQKSEHMYF